MVAMKKCCLFLLLLLCFTTSKAVEPWSGIGVVFFRCHYPEMTEESIDVDIFDSTLTKVIMTINSKNYYTIKDVDFVEFADEVKGLCMVSIQGNAIKVILNDRDGHVQYGWLKRNDKNINHYLWSSLIPYQKEVFPINNEKGVATIPFFKNPDGEILNIEIPKMNEVWYDYKNEIVKVFDCDLIPTGIVSHGTWMQIDVSYPHDEGQDDFECHRIRCWIRYLDDSGHPLVWYHTRD